MEEYILDGEKLISYGELRKRIGMLLENNEIHKIKRDINEFKVDMEVFLNDKSFNFHMFLNRQNNYGKELIDMLFNKYYNQRQIDFKNIKQGTKFLDIVCSFSKDTTSYKKYFFDDIIRLDIIIDEEDKNFLNEVFSLFENAIITYDYKHNEYGKALEEDLNNYSLKIFKKRLKINNAPDEIMERGKKYGKE